MGFHIWRLRDIFLLPFCQFTGSPPSLGYWLHVYPLQKPHPCAFSNPNMTSSPQAPSLFQLLAQQATDFPQTAVRSSFQDSRQFSYLCGWKWYLLVVLHTHFSGSLLPGSLFFSYKDCLPWLQPHGHALLQVCFPGLGLHSFLLPKSEDKCAKSVAKTAQSPLPTPSN